MADDGTVLNVHLEPALIFKSQYLFFLILLSSYYTVPFKLHVIARIWF